MNWTKSMNKHKIELIREDAFTWIAGIIQQLCLFDSSLKENGKKLALSSEQPN